MSDTIRYIETGRVFPHPENPRRDVGDVTELADSIRAQGILQNLTVIPWDEVHEEPAPVPDAVVVVIGHRRLAAAKQAGLEKLPCFPTHMDRKTQISTMLLENMQRADLTIPEQAAGFQLMMDLGATVEEISEQTGFAARTVQRRLQIAKLPKDLLQKSWEKGGCTLEEYAKIAALKSEGARNKVLRAVGTSNFDWELRSAQEDEQRIEARRHLKERFKKEGIPKYSGKESSPAYSPKYDRLLDEQIIKYKDGTENLKLPKDLKDVTWHEYGNWFCLIRPAKKKTIEHKSKKAMAADAQRKALEDLTKRAYNSRKAFVTGYQKTPKDVLQEELLRWAVIGMTTATNYDLLWELVEQKKKPYERPAAKDILKMIKIKPERLAWLIYAFTGDDASQRTFHPNWDEKPPEYRRNERLERIYDFLNRLGYEVSDEERQMLDGTHALYGKREEKKDAAEKS